MRMDPHCYVLADWMPVSNQKICFGVKIYKHTVELHWLEHLWDHGNLFQIWIVRATES